MKEVLSSLEVVVGSLASAKTRQSILALLLCSLLIVLGFSVFSWAGPEQMTLTEEEKIIHLLSRLSFGPRPGDIERVAAMGIQAYIEQQLRPELIAETVVEEKLASFKTLTMTPRELAEFYPAPNDLRSQRQRLQAERQNQEERNSGEMDTDPEPDRTEEMQEARRQM